MGLTKGAVHCVAMLKGPAISDDPRSNSLLEIFAKLGATPPSSLQ